MMRYPFTATGAADTGTHVMHAFTYSESANGAHASSAVDPPCAGYLCARFDRFAWYEVACTQVLSAVWILIRDEIELVLDLAG
jgi:hypothetical protein